MAEQTQTYATHVRRDTPWLFGLFPLLLLHFLYTAYRLYQSPDFAHVEALLLAFGLLWLLVYTRINPMRVQDRVIRLEEQLRYQRLLPPDLAARAGQLPIRFITALRFASDEELPELARQVVEQKFEKPADVKQAVKAWRADFMRV